MPSDSRRQIRVHPLGAAQDDPPGNETTPAARVEMMWQLALDAWAFKGEPVSESGLSRHLVRVLRRGR